MTAARTPPVPAKTRLTWRIARLRLDESGRRWIASGFKGERVATIVLPEPSVTDPEEDWFGRIEAAFEGAAFDPILAAHPELDLSTSPDGALARGRLRALGALSRKT
jgi:hypothetical protein